MADAVVQSVVPAAVDTTDLSRIYTAHSRRIRGLLMRLGVAPGDAEDALHETFVVAWRRIHTLRDPEALVAWLNGIAVRVEASLRRRAQLRRFVGLESISELAESTTPASELDTRRAQRLVYAALDGIADKKRTVFILFELHGMTGHEIAAIVGCPLKTVWTRLFHARREFLARVTVMERVSTSDEQAR